MSIEQGLLAEHIFITECISKDIEILQPIVDKWGYDFIINANGYLKIQVKSCSVADMRYPKRPTYKFNVRKGKNSRAYENGDFDLLAAYIIPLDTWYLIPISEINNTTIRINPNNPKNKYYMYKNNFMTLKGELIHKFPQ